MSHRTAISCKPDITIQYPCLSFPSLLTLLDKTLPSLSHVSQPNLNCEVVTRGKVLRWSSQEEASMAEATEMELVPTNMLSRLVITFLPRSKHLLISWLQSYPTLCDPIDGRQTQYIASIFSVFLLERKQRSADFRYRVFPCSI